MLYHKYKKCNCHLYLFPCSWPFCQLCHFSHSAVSSETAPNTLAASHLTEDWGHLTQEFVWSKKLKHTTKEHAHRHTHFVNDLNWYIQPTINIKRHIHAKFVANTCCFICFISIALCPSLCVYDDTPFLTLPEPRSQPGRESSWCLVDPTEPTHHLKQGIPSKWKSVL